MDENSLREAFLTEAREHLDSLESGLLALREGSDEDGLLDRLFRGAHSVKGGAGAVNLGAIVKLTHTLEGLLDDLRTGKRTADDDLIGVLLKGSDQAGTLLDLAAEGHMHEPDWLQGAISALKTAREAGPSAAAVRVGPRQDWRLTIKPNEDILLMCNDPLPVLELLGQEGLYQIEADLAAVPALADLDPSNLYVAWTVELRDGPPRAELDAILRILEGEAAIAIVALERAASAPPPNKPDTSKRKAAGARPARGKGSIRVDTERIDQLLDEVGELVIAQAIVSERARDAAAEDRALAEGIKQLERRMRFLQDSVLTMRMRPIRDLFERVPRLVFELGRDLGKQVKVEMNGEWTEVDREVLEKLSDPMVHLVRNALDHGLETPDQRLAAGKDPMGTLLLSASHQGGDVVIKIGDDGRGLDPERIRAKAIERGLIDANANLEEPQICEMIFEAGFSTAAAVTNVSGRGVGMDVVRQNIEALSGRVAVHNRFGHGATFEIVLPLTLAILDGQLLHAGETRFVLPVRSMVECLRPEPRHYVNVQGIGRTYMLRGQHLPVVRLTEAFHLEGGSDADPLLVVIEAAGQRVALEVQAVGSQRQFVLKSLDRNHRAIAGLAGATVLTDGGLALVLDASTLASQDLGEVREHRRQHAREAKAEPLPAPEPVGETLLTIRSGDAIFAVPAGRVGEIRAWQGATPLPFSPPGLIGGVNMGGEVVPVWDARTLLGHPQADVALRAVVVYLRARGRADSTRLLGLVVDEVIDVRPHDPTSMSTDDLTPGLRGLIPCDGSVISLLDVDRLGLS